MSGNARHALFNVMEQVICSGARARKMVVPVVLFPVLVAEANGQIRMSHDFHQIYSSEAPNLYGYLVKRTDPDSAQDIMQEAFARLYARLHKMADISNTRAYLFQIARHLLYRQTDSRRLQGSEALLENLPAPDSAADAARLEERELMQTLYSAVGSLAANERELFELRWNQGLTQTEIAIVLKKSERQVRRDLEKLVNNLRAVFRQKGWPGGGSTAV
jgi:RNA polymerase sigma-70 factor (ECF subfamily)